MKSVIIIAIIGLFVLGNYAILDSFAQNSEESLGTSMFNVSSIIATAFLVLIIPIIIFLLIMLKKGKLTKSELKFSLIGMGVFFLALMIVGISSFSFLSDEEKVIRTAEIEEERRAEEERERIVQQQAERDAEQRKLQEIAAQREAELKDEKLSTEELQTVIAGFESYNKSVKILLDMCVNVESETNFVLLGLLINESGNDFQVNTANYGAVRDKLMAEGYGEHPVLGPLMDQSVILVDQMSTCMEVLAWEFSG